MQAQRSNRVIVGTALLLGISLIRPHYPFEQFLQHAPTVVALLLLAQSVRRGWMGEKSVYCVVGFLLLHILGARYIYSNVPYDDWTGALFGSPLSSWFGWERNHYDRLVHFGFGLLGVLPLFEWGHDRGGLSRNWAILFAVGGILALSAVYEIFEWLLTIVASPEDADSYNGQQGDPWDAQKDMALAFLGSLLALPFLPRHRAPRAVLGEAASKNI